MEIEGKKEEEVKTVTKELEFNYSEGMFCAIGTIYAQKYNLPERLINNKIPKIVFNMKNPFIL